MRWVVISTLVLGSGVLAQAKGLEYPQTKEDEIVHVDSYRWLEENSQGRAQWLHKQNNFTQNVIQGFSSYSWWAQVLKKRFHAPRVLSRSQDKSEYEIQVYNRGDGKNVDVYRVKGNKHTYLYSTNLKDLDEPVSFFSPVMSPDKQHVLLTFTRNGSTDEGFIVVVHIESGEIIETLKDVQRGSVSWHSHREFYYERWIQGVTGAMFSHRIGEKQEQDEFIDEPRRVLNSAEKKVVIRSAREGSEIKRLSEGQEWRPIQSSIQNIYGFWEDSILVEASGGKVVKLKTVEKPNAIEVVQENEIDSHKEYVIGRAYVRDDLLVVHTSLGKNQKIHVYELNNKNAESQIEVPGCCLVRNVRADSDDRLKVTLSSPVNPGKDFIFDKKSSSFTENPEEAMLKDESGNSYAVEYVNVKSKDGAEVPVRMVYKKQMNFDGKRPTLIQGYGGFGSSSYFYPKYSSWQEMKFLSDGGLLVFPALRGGGEFGRKWRNQAVGKKKQNTFNDLFATAEYLISSGKTTSKNIAIYGWSNGGLLTGAAVTQRPDLFNLAVVGAGVLDSLRKEHLDYRFGQGWSYEYGSSHKADHWKFLRDYSPVANAKKGDYPSVLIITGDADSRVNPAHSYKLAAAMQKAQQNESNPIMLSAIEGGGHWMNSDRLQADVGWQSLAHIFATIYEKTGLTIKEDKGGSQALHLK